MSTIDVYIQLTHTEGCTECSKRPWKQNDNNHTGFQISVDSPRWLVAEYPTSDQLIEQVTLHNPVQEKSNHYLSHGVGYYDTQLKRWLLKVEVEEYWEATDHPTMAMYELANQNPPDEDTVNYEYDHAREWLAEDIERQLDVLGLKFDHMEYSEHRSGPVVKGTGDMLNNRHAWKKLLPIWLEKLNMNQYRDSFKSMWDAIAKRYTEVRYYQNIIITNGRAMRVDLPYQQFVKPLGYSSSHPMTRVYCEVEPPSFKRCLLELTTYMVNRADFSSVWIHSGGGDGYFQTDVGDQYPSDYLSEAFQQYNDLEISDLPHGKQYEIVKNNPTIRRLLMRHRLDILIQTFVSTQWDHIFEGFVDQCHEAFQSIESWLGSTEWYKEEIEGRDLVFDADGYECYRGSLPVLHYLYPSEKVQQ